MDCRIVGDGMNLLKFAEPAKVLCYSTDAGAETGASVRLLEPEQVRECLRTQVSVSLFNFLAPLIETQSEPREGMALML